MCCVGLDGGECMTEDGWMFHRDHAQTVAVSSDADDYLVLSLGIGGFHGVGLQRHHHQQAEVARLSFEFETHCSSPRCEFALLRVCYSLTTVYLTCKKTVTRQVE